MRKVLIPLAATVLVIAVLPLKTRTGDHLALGATPAVVLRDIDGYRSEDLDGEEVRRRLNAHSLQVRRYTDASGRSFLVNVVISGKSRMAIHRPELCLNCQGFLVSDARTESVVGTDWRCYRVVRADDLPAAFAYRYLNQDGFETASQSVRLLRDMWDRSVHGRINRWVLVTVMASSEDATEMTAFLAKLRL